MRGKFGARPVVSWLLLVALIGPGLAALSGPPTVQAIQKTPKPASVTVAGTIQSKLTCPGDWKPECSATFLKYNPDYDLWTGSFNLPAGDYEYKAALNGSWDENYGAKAQRGGSNISLPLPGGGPVKFYYDHKTNWITDNKTSVIATVVGNFQSKIGCQGDNKPDCLRTWLQSPKGDKIYLWTTNTIPPGSYDARVAINETLDETYGANGVKNGPPVSFQVPFQGAALTFKYEAASQTLTVGPAQQGDLSLAQAHWVSRDTLAWKVDGNPANQYRLHYDPVALKLEPQGVSGGSALTLNYDPGGLSKEIVAKFPHLAGFSALKVAPADQAKIADIIQGTVAVSASAGANRLLDATGVQLPGLLDDLFAYNDRLGVVYNGSAPALRLWAPTARSVKLNLYDTSTTTTRNQLDMTRDPKTGVWSASGQPDWTGKFYLYEIEVYTPSTGKVERNFVTDPYSVSLATNSRRSQIVNLSDPSLRPAGWETLKKPELAAFEDIVLYELHLRDFSSNDKTVPEDKRGTYLAFSESNSDGMKHLKNLAQAGLTHLHLLPVFDISSINENKAERKEADPADIKGGPDSESQQQTLSKFLDTDAFNWGYDPAHYMVPEGSYATNPDGSTRIKEFREMVKALNESGLRVVMDVVYNHTSASGQDQKAVLDRIVPGYYHRLNAEGRVENSTCCANTATEHLMMEKLMVDTLVTWATVYKVDGFRFDLMGHHMLSNMLKVRDTLRSLTLEKDGVDGSKIYIYGEGWNFGEVADNKRGVNATQLNLAGTGIGTFNDRLRDAARGGGPFSGLQEQGFVSGLLSAPNGTNQGDTVTQTTRLLQYSDWIKVGLAGGLKDFTLTDYTGKSVTGAQVDYNGAPAGYNLDPQENIVYVEAHDNETLFDALALKAPPATSMADRVRMQNLGTSLVSLSQGVPFFHAGQDMLRSKSLDRDSYNSGDYFNKLDFTFQTNNWGVGLPNQSKNGSNWPIMRMVLANPNIKPDQASILASVRHTEEMLRLRKSSPLFRLRSGDEVKSRLKFLNNGPQQIPGLIVMNLSDNAGPPLDPEYSRIIVVFNGTNQAHSFVDKSLEGSKLVLHPLQAASADLVVRTSSTYKETLTVPAYTTAVFVEKRAASAGVNPAGQGGAGPGQVPAAGQGGGLTAQGSSGLAAGLGLLAAIAGLAGWGLWRGRQTRRRG